jgi:MscS family membrane protein
VPEDPFARGTPRRSVAGFLEAARHGDVGRAREYLDVRSVPASGRDSRSEQLASQLQVVLDRKLWLDPETLSDDPQGDTEDGLPEAQELVGTIDTGRGSVPIQLQRVASESGTPIWKFASVTVRRIPELYELYGYTPIERQLPEWMLQSRWLGVSFWVVSALFGLFLTAAFASWVVVLAIAAVLRWVTAHTSTDADDKLVRGTAGPLRLAAGVAVFHAGRAFITLSAPAQHVLATLEMVGLVAAIAWFALRFVDLFTLAALRRLHIYQSGASLGWLPLVQKIAKTVVVVIAGIALLDRFGFNVTALLASLGLGGVVVALSAQKSMENLFGGVSVLVDRPVRVGDFCKVGDFVGRVEEIGLRSTRLRTLERTVVSIPNADFSAQRIENLDARDEVWYHPSLALRFDTTPEQLYNVLEQTRELLQGHPRLEAHSSHVRFFRFGAGSLDLDVVAYVKTRDWDEFLAIAEELNIRIMEIVARCGTALAQR